MSEENRVVDLLEELVKWTKVTSIPQVKKVLLELLTTPEEKKAYQLSDGERTIRKVAKKSNLSTFKVSKLWGSWINAGIAEPIPVKGGGSRAKKNFSLDDFGIEST